MPSVRTVDELGRDARMYLSRALNRSLTPPDWLTVNLTLRCNLTCVMCTTCYDAPELTREEVFDLIDQAAAWGVRVFNPLGGEPFIRPDLEDLLDRAARRDLHVTLTTNATLISRARADRVARIPPEKLHLNVSIDGLAPTHDAVRGRGSHARALAGYHHLREADEAVGNARRKICANVILHRRNLEEFDVLLETLAAEGYTAVQVLNLFRNPEDPQVGGLWFDAASLPALERLCERLAEGAPLPLLNPPDDLRRIPRYYREGLAPLEAPCWAGWKELYVNADGSTIMCDGRLDFLAGRFGNVREHTLRELWASPALRARREVVKACATPCLQACYLRRESDSARVIAAGLAEHALAGARARLARWAPLTRVDQALTLELCDTPDDPTDPRLRRLFARSPVALDALADDPDQLDQLRDRHYLDFGRGFLGAELLDRLLDDLRGARLRFAAVAVRWRGEPLLHPEPLEVFPRLRRAVSDGLFDRWVVSTSGRLYGGARRVALEGAELWVDPGPWAGRGGRPGRPRLRGPVVSWDGKLTLDPADTSLGRVAADVLRERFGDAWRRVSRGSPHAADPGGVLR